MAMEYILISDKPGPSQSVLNFMCSEHNFLNNMVKIYLYVSYNQDKVWACFIAWVCNKLLWLLMFWVTYDRRINSGDFSLILITSALSLRKIMYENYFFCMYLLLIYQSFFWWVDLLNTSYHLMYTLMALGKAILTSSFEQCSIFEILLYMILLMKMFP